MALFEITTREIAIAQYLVTAPSEEAAREAFENGEFDTHKQIDAQIDEILEVEEIVVEGVDDLLD